MVECPICQKAFKDGRALHAHMLKSHLNEYRAKGCKLSAFGIDAPFSATRKKPDVETPAPDARDPGRPAGFRMLNRADDSEAIAYGYGYRYVDGELNVYTSREAKARGWI